MHDICLEYDAKIAHEITNHERARSRLPKFLNSELY